MHLIKDVTDIRTAIIFNFIVIVLLNNFRQKSFGEQCLGSEECLMPFICDASYMTCSCNPDTHVQYGQGCLTIKSAAPVENVDCKTDTLGQDYRGFIKVTMFGIDCQRWDHQTPHHHKIPNSHLMNHNYCRNPDMEDEGPWCYTMNASVRWQYCLVSFCGKECFGNIPCGANLVCDTADNYTCKCIPSTHYRYGEACAEKKSFGEQCLANEECLMPFICDASNNTCSCNPDTDTYFQYGQGCLPKKSFGEQCFTNEECLMPFICDASNKTCSCNPDTHVQHGHGCLTHKALGEECTISIQCPLHNICSTTDNTCHCNSATHYQEGQICLEKKSIGETCIINDECSLPIICDTTTHTCQCNSGTHYQDGQVCLEKKSLGEHCLDSGQCTVPPLICNTTEKSCKCDPTTYYQNGQVCEEKIAATEACVNGGPSDQCFGSIAVCSSISGSYICYCDPNVYYVMNKDCHKIGGFLEPCSVAMLNTSCTQGLSCVQDKCVCADPMLIYNSTEKQCKSADVKNVEVVTSIVANTLTIFTSNTTETSTEEKQEVVDNLVNVLVNISANSTKDLTSAVKNVEALSQSTELLSESAQDTLVDFLDKTLEDSAAASDTDFAMSFLESTSNLLDLSIDSSESLFIDDEIDDYGFSFEDETETTTPEPTTVTSAVITGDQVNNGSTSQPVTTTTVPTTTTTLKPTTSPPVIKKKKKLSKKKVAELEKRTKKILTTVNKLADTILSNIGEKPGKVQIQTKSISLSLAVDTFNETENATKSYTTKFEKNGKKLDSSFEVPSEVAKSLPSSENLSFRSKMILHAKNPYFWDPSSAYITTPTVDLSLLDYKGRSVEVKGLHDPMVIKIPNADDLTFQEFIIETFNKSDKEMFLRCSIQHPGTLSVKIIIKTNLPDYNVTLKYAMNSDRKISMKDVQTGDDFDKNETVIFKQPHPWDLQWSIGFLPVINSTEEDISPNISISIASVGISCRYWEESSGQWLTTGCFVSSSSMFDTAICKCDHLTEFGAGYFVLPNIVDPIADALLFLTFFENPVIVSTTVVLWMLYLLLLYWARKVDRRDQSEAAILTPYPSNPKQKYKYLVCIVTTWRINAGTTANVSCYIEGHKSRSAKHCLTSSCGNRTLFKSGSEEWFLITSSIDLGEIKRVHVWHDNSGSSPSWLLSRILVEDLQTKGVYHFLFNAWLDIFKGVTKVALSKTSAEEFKTLRKNQFFMRVAGDLRTGHVIFSIISNNANDNLSRTQRLSCAWSIMLWTMLTCLMFQGIETDDDVSTEISGFEFSISIKDIIIGIQSSIIMFPVNYIIVQLFLRTAKKKEKIQKYSEINDDNLVEEVGNLKGRKMLPWWMIYFNWTFVTVTSLIATYFVMLYGLKFGYNSSLEWLVSFIAAFFDEAFVLEPVNVAAMAFLFTFILRRPYQLGNAPTSVLQTSNDQTTEEKKQLPGHDSNIAFIPPPISRKRMIAAKKEYELQKRIRTKLQDICLYILFTLVLFFVVHSSKSVEHCFRQTEVVKHLTRLEVFKKNTEVEYELSLKGNITILDKAWKEIHTSEEIFAYTRSTLLPTLMRTLPYEMTIKTAENDFLLLGKVRVRQIRVEKGSCTYPLSLTELFALKLNCTDSLSLLNDDTQSYDQSWKAPIETPTVSNEWTFQSALDIKSVPYIGQLTIYGGGGYIVDLKNDNSALQKISSLQNYKWLDERTKAVFIELTLYNVNLNLFSSVMLVVEYSLTGGLLKSGEIFTTPLSSFNTNQDVTRIVFEIFFCILTFFFIYIEYKKTRQKGFKKYIWKFWSIISIFQLALCIVMLALYIEKYIMVEYLLEEFRSNGQDMFYNFGFAVMFDNIASYISAILVAVTTLKFIKLLMFNSQLKYLLSMIENTKSQLKAFTFLFIVCLIAFTTCAYLLFGSSLYGHRSFMDSFMTLIESTIRIMNFHEYAFVLPVIGPCFLSMYIFVFVFILMKVFTVIVINAVITVKKHGVEQNNELALMVRYLIDSIRIAFR